jgi:predicted glycoside hydrolase/deacetylase ChbG (UPF0249 family)
MSVRMIFNADDLGRTIGINDGIFEAHARGLVRSATMMVGYESSWDAGRRLAEHPDLGVGLHLTLSGARPTLPAAQVPSLVDERGLFPRKPEFFVEPKFDEVLAEARHQLRLFHEMTRRVPTHFDSHHHSHRHPVVAEAVVTLASELGVPVRRSSEALAERFRVGNVKSTDSFSEAFYGTGATTGVLLDLLAHASTGHLGASVEVMCHPGYADPSLRAESDYSYAREGEIAVLCDPALLEVFRSLGLVNSRFDELP